MRVFTRIDTVLPNLVELQPSLLTVGDASAVMWNPADAHELGLTDVTMYDEDTPVDVMPDQVVMHLLPLLKTYRDRIATLEARLEVAMGLVDDAHVKLAKLVGDSAWS